MRVLVVGGGAREHALCWRLARSSQVERVLAAPGNAGLASVATPVAVAAGDAPGLIELARRERVELVVVGPEAPLVAGVADRLREAGLAVLGPSAAAARIEGSKAWAMDLCHRHGIPAPRSERAPDLSAALALAAEWPLPAVIKADGLMAGKGVLIAPTRAQALDATRQLAAHGPVVFEEFLEGAELSGFALCDGRRALALGCARDHKRLGAGNTGPMTGGMGAYAPVAGLGEGTAAAVRDILQGAVDAMAAEGCPFTGFLFAGLMLTPAGPRVLEFNCRLGDPEAQALLPLWAGDPVPLWQRAAAGALAPDDRVVMEAGAALGVVLASPGYPAAPEPGQEIWGLDAGGQPAAGGALCFHAATVQDGAAWRTAGGRVLTLVGRAADLEGARTAAYAAVASVGFDGAQWRSDMGRAEGTRGR